MTLSAEKAAPAFTNRLVREKSPYLLQHAHNPVEWHPWGEAAFAKARKENKPIFLSIGYSTCHWCHVMERESFEDPEVASLLNRDFVSVKVDREERPDVDSVYMTYVQATAGGGGWPMSVWLTPMLKPFFGGTYFPREDVAGRPGFKTLLRRIAAAWRADRDGLEASGESAIAQLQAAIERPQAGEPADARTLDNALVQFEEAYDPVNGGFGGQPKFPRPSVLHFLFRHHARTGNPKPLAMALHTLRCMADGGIHDRLGGGFHRYAVDARWHVPHFEKMLYDQAQLAMAALDAFQITREPFFESLTRDILEYVRRDLTGPEGQFYSAEDADSPEPAQPEVLAEGSFYVWEAREIKEALGDRRAAIYCRHYGVRLDGNVAETVAPELSGKNILSVVQTLEETAKAYGATPEEVKRILDQSRLRLLEVRSARPRPRLDDKAVTAWNGMMISAFARACQVLGDPVYRDLAERAALFIRNRLSRENGEYLWRRYRDGEAAVDGGSADYAFVIQALLDLYETLFDPAHLSWALALQDRQDRLFWDQKQGGYFDSAADPRILLRLKESYDGAEPSANSVSASNLLRLHHLSPRNGFDKRAEIVISAFSKTLQEAPDSAPQLLAALELRLAGISQVVIAGRRDATDTQDMMKALRRTFLPGALTLLVDPGKGEAELARRAPFIRDMTMIDDKATAYVCRNFSCRLPTTDSRVMLEQLTQRSDSQAGARTPPG